jgi:hypothetical protein
VFVLFVLLERESLRDRLIRLVSRGKYTVTTRAINDAATRISRYVLAQTIVNGTYGIAIAIGLWIIGRTLGHSSSAPADYVPPDDFPSFVLWGLLCAVLRFIPYVGPWVAAIFPVALSLAVYPGFSVFIAVLAMFVVIELLSNNVMEPWLYGVSTGLSTVAIIVAAVFWTWLWGPIGLLLSTPMTVCIVVIGKYVAQLQFFDVLLGDQAALPPAVSYYQRLLAGDRTEAAQLAKEVAKERGREHVPDEVFLPALLLTRRDREDDALNAENETNIYAATAEVVDETLRPTEPPKATEPKAAGVSDAASPSSESHIARWPCSLPGPPSRRRADAPDAGAPAGPSGGPLRDRVDAPAAQRGAAAGLPRRAGGGLHRDHSARRHHPGPVPRAPASQGGARR